MAEENPTFNNLGKGERFCWDKIKKKKIVSRLLENPSSYKSETSNTTYCWNILRVYQNGKFGYLRKNYFGWEVGIESNWGIRVKWRHRYRRRSQTSRSLVMEKREMGW